MTILLSGASGFLGSCIQKRILHQSDEQIITVGSSRLSHLVREEGRINPPESGELSLAIRDVSTILHVGSYTPKRAKDANDKKNLENIEFTSNLLNMQLPNLESVIYASSIDVYGNSREKYTEESPTSPLTLYGKTKLESEILVREACVKRGLNYKIVRIGHLYGPGDSNYSKFLQNLIKAAKEHSYLDVYGDGSQHLQLLDVRDAAECIFELTKLTNATPILNLVHPIQVSLNQLIEKVEVQARIKIKKKFIESRNMNRSYIQPNELFGLREDNLRTVDSWIIESFPKK